MSEFLKNDIDYYDDRYNDYDHFLEMKRQEKYLITFDMIPPLQANRNVRSASFYLLGHYHGWGDVRDFIEDKNKGVCECCGKTNFDRQYFDEKKKITSNTDCHEVWRFIEVKKPVWNRVQKLVKLKSLCFYCHKICHIDQVHDNSKKNILIEDYAKFNKITLEQAKKDYEYAVKRKELNANYEFKLDMSLINKFNLELQFHDNLFDCHTKEFNNFLYTDFLDDE